MRERIARKVDPSGCEESSGFGKRAKEERIREVTKL